MITRQPEREQWKAFAISWALICGLLLIWTSAAQALPNPVPFISGISPVSASPGGSQFTLTVTGAGFVSGSIVDWNGAALSTTYVSATKLTATVPASDIAVNGAAWITVVNPAPGGGPSSLLFLPITGSSASIALTPSSYAVGSYPYSISIGDFNGDGKLDLAIPNVSSNTVSVLLGNGDGTFQAQKTTAVGGEPDYIAVGDFNGDGKLDMAVTNFTTSNLYILLGNGDGTFPTSHVYSTGNNPYSVVTGDFNGDGKLDLAVANESSANVSIFLGNGDGTFQAPVTYTVGFSPQYMAVGDFNGDGKLDLAVANASGSTVSILLGNGDGTFQSQVIYAVGVSPNYVVAGDFNGDGKLDLAVANDGNHTVSILLGNGDGTFQTQVSYAVGSNPFGLAAGDINGDGKLDLAVANTGSSTVSILLGNGDGTFQSQSVFSTGSGSGPRGTVMADFDHSGRLGVAVADSSSGHATVLLQTASVSPSSLSFGNQNIGVASTAKTVTLTNTSGGTLNSLSVSFTGTNKSDFSQTNTCGTSLAVNANCTINVTFTPGGAGARAASLTLSGSATIVPSSIALTGTGVGPTAVLSQTSITFSNQNVQTTSTAQGVTLTNNGTAALSITSVTASGDFAETNTCGSSVAVSGSCNLSITFTPTMPGTRSGSISIIDNAGGSPQTMTLSGMGLGAGASLSTSSLAFANQQVGVTSTPQPVTLTNSGNEALAIASITPSGDFGETNDCGTGLAAGGHCTIQVTFTPTIFGTRTGSIRITDNAPGSPQPVTLTGTGLSPVAALAPGSVTFPSEANGTSSAPQTVTLTNTGNAPLAITGIQASPGSFTETNTCSASLAAGANCMILITFTPAGLGTFTGSLTVMDNATGSPQTVPLSGTGTGPAIALSASSLNAGPAIVGASGSPQQVTLTNRSSAPVAITGIVASPNSFTDSTTCSTTLAAGASCMVTVIYTATSGGEQTGTLSISTSASSTPLVVALSGAGQDFSLGSYVTTATVQAGNTGVYLLKIGSEGAFSGTVSLSCSSGAVQGVSCSLSQNQVSLSGAGAASVTMYLKTAAPSLGALWPGGAGGTLPPLGLWLSILVMLGLLSLPALSRQHGNVHRRVALFAGLLLMVAALGTGCGGLASLPSAGAGSSGTRAGTYNVTVTATSGKLAHSTQVKLVVK